MNDPLTSHDFLIPFFLVQKIFSHNVEIIMMNQEMLADLKILKVNQNICRMTFKALYHPMIGNCSMMVPTRS